MTNRNLVVFVKGGTVGKGGPLLHALITCGAWLDVQVVSPGERSEKFQAWMDSIEPADRKRKMDVVWCPWCRAGIGFVPTLN